MTDPIYDKHLEPTITKAQTPIGEIELVNGRLSDIHSPRYFSDWIMKYGGNLDTNIDVAATRLGHALLTIRDDDENFYFLPSVTDETEGVNFERSRQGSLSRIDWELSIPGMSEELRDRLSELKEMISNQNWTDIESRAKGRAAFRGIRDDIKESEEVKAHIDTYLGTKKQLWGKWTEFLKENGLIPKGY
ncbi:MAG TPA: hypothetical protein PKU78_04255 [Candidatus Dojkabacteria bacterium]|nr:hypothetical protein [Candidatus Dojkabacteria bacterium]HRO65406.1 hypothetical protein [Candidatus Dojkabacteria bacterium]HRP50888.1 hypothetical protein [Candidatus Dojkabacteria bacterium]